MRLPPLLNQFSGSFWFQQALQRSNIALRETFFPVKSEKPNIFYTLRLAIKTMRSPKY
jgi:hypothetical protein